MHVALYICLSFRYWSLNDTCIKQESAAAGNYTGLILNNIFLFYTILQVPPLPQRPEVDAKAAESKSKKQLGSDTKIVIPDEFSRDCRQIEKCVFTMI